MMRRAFLVVVIGVAATAPASAQSWGVGVGVEFGEPGYYYDAPPGYYYGEPPVVYAPAPPPVLYAPPPVVYAPPPAVPSAVPADVVFDKLERRGYRNFGPMAFRDGVYKLNAVNRRGDFVALEVSALTGDVDREFVVNKGRRADVAAPAPAPIAPVPSRAAPQPDRDPLVVY